MSPLFRFCTIIYCTEVVSFCSSVYSFFSSLTCLLSTGPLAVPGTSEKADTDPAFRCCTGLRGQGLGKERSQCWLGGGRWLKSWALWITESYTPLVSSPTMCFEADSNIWWFCLIWLLEVPSVCDVLLKHFRKPLKCVPCLVINKPHLPSQSTCFFSLTCLFWILSCPTGN